MKTSQWIALIVIVVGLFWIVSLIDSLPEELHTRQLAVEKVDSMHRKALANLEAAKTLDHKSEVAEKYVLDSQIWEAEIRDYIRYLQSLKGQVFLTTRNQTLIAGKVRSAQALQEVVHETAIMLQNALRGEMEPRHRALGEMTFGKQFEEFAQKSRKSAP